MYYICSNTGLKSVFFYIFVCCYGCVLLGGSTFFLSKFNFFIFYLKLFFFSIFILFFMY